MTEQIKPKQKRTRKPAELKAKEVLEAFTKLPFDEKKTILPELQTAFENEKEQLRASAQATLDKLK